MLTPLVSGEVPTTDELQTYITLFGPDRSPKTLQLTFSTLFAHLFVTFDISIFDHDITEVAILRFVFSHGKLTYLIKFIQNRTFKIKKSLDTNFKDYRCFATIFAWRTHADRWSGIKQNYSSLSVILRIISFCTYAMEIYRI